MVRSISCLAVIALLAGMSARAGELDKEFKSATPAAAANITKDSPAAPLLAASGGELLDAWKASELDAESPSQAFGHGGFGHGGFGHGGFGHGGFGWGGHGFGRGIGWGGW